jgi:coenzyme F420-dependent glucose-6-phosphate dehydrogenase
LEMGYFAALEQFQPDVLLERAVRAEKVGFKAIWCSDHFHPWVHSNASAGFAWTWMASAAEKTKLPIGTAVTAPLFRYHPAIVAQAFATLSVMYPNRIILGLGSGEPINESPLGYNWPSTGERIERFEEALNIIRLLWTKSFVNFAGKHYQLRKANLYTKPAMPPPIYIAVGGPLMAKMAGKYADGIITAPTPGQPSDFYRKRMFDPLQMSAKDNGREGATLEKVALVKVSYHEDYETALRSCRFWASELLPFIAKYDVYDPREIEKWTQVVGQEAIEKLLIVSNEPDEHIRRLEEYARQGFTHLAIHSTSPDEQKFLDVYGKEVIPSLSAAHNK